MQNLNTPNAKTFLFEDNTNINDKSRQLRSQVILQKTDSLWEHLMLKWFCQGLRI